MSKLREILDLLRRGIRAEKSMGISTDNYIDDAIYDIKKWAKRCVPTPLVEGKEHPLLKDEMWGYRECGNDTLKNIEEDKNGN